MQRCEAYLQIWAAFKVENCRPAHFRRVNEYADFFVWLPPAAIGSFVLEICSLFDSGKGCITLDAYKQFIEERQIIPSDVDAKMVEAAARVAPLKKVRNAYYAHRLVEGSINDLIAQNKLTCDEMFAIMDLTRSAAEALCILAGHKLPPLKPLPQTTFARLLADLPPN